LIFSGIYKCKTSGVCAAIAVAMTLQISACGSPLRNSSVTSDGSSARASSSASAVGITDCSEKTVMQPKSLVLACGDANTAASGLVWQGWGETTTIGRGTISVMVCDPNCAAGTKSRNAPGTLTASRLQVCPDGQRRYTRLTYDYQGNTTGPIAMTIPCPPYQP
jgi:hypothetical protein